MTPTVPTVPTDVTTTTTTPPAAADVAVYVYDPRHHETGTVIRSLDQLTHELRAAAVAGQAVTVVPLSARYYVGSAAAFLGMSRDELLRAVAAGDLRGDERAGFRFADVLVS